MENKSKVRNQRNNKKSSNHTSETQKKPFNKKRYREQKYSNKFKVTQWDEKRKKTLLKDLYKDLKKDEKFSNLNILKKPNSVDHSESSKNSLNPKLKNPFFSAKQESIRKKEEQQRKKEEILRVKREREEALKKYKQKRMKAFMELSKKTKKGQPVMKGRMELLLQKIQRST